MTKDNLCKKWKIPSDKYDEYDIINGAYIVHKCANIHDSAVICRGSCIGKNVQICENVHIGDDVFIGEQSYIGKNTHIGNNVYIGEVTRIRISDDDKGIEIYDDVVIGDFCDIEASIKSPVIILSGTDLRDPVIKWSDLSRGDENEVK